MNNQECKKKLHKRGNLEVPFYLDKPFLFFILTTKKILKFIHEYPGFISTGKFLTIVTVVSSYTEFYAGFRKRIKSEGPKEACRFYKEIYNISCRIAMGLPHEPLKFCRADKEGIPSILANFKPMLRSDNLWCKRIALMGIRLYPLVRLPIDRSVENLTRPARESPLRDEVLKDFCKFIKSTNKVQLTYRPLPRRENLLVGTGPNGSAMMTSHLDVYAHIIEGRIDRILEYWEQCYAPMQDLLQSMVRKPIDFSNYPRLRTAKISFIPENGGKTRLIAILDYWSQMLLKPMHTAMMSLIKTYKTDGTFNQNLLFEKILGTKTNYTASFDLRAATDRFPIEPQVTLIESLFGKEKRDMWVDLLIDREFWYTDNDKSYKSVRWNVGQPLGAYSSWVTFSLTHHYLVHFCAATCRTPFKYGNFDKYFILGDDIVIMDKVVAERYMDVMSDLDVEIHTGKSFIADGKHCGEFTKRLFLNQKEISPIPITQILSVQESLYNLPGLLESMQQRWNLIGSLLELWALSPSNFTKKTQLLAILFAFRHLINGTTQYPFCQYDRESTLLELRSFIYEKVIKRKMDSWENVFNPPPSGVSVSNSSLPETLAKLPEDHIIHKIFLNWESRQVTKLANTPSSIADEQMFAECLQEEIDPEGVGKRPPNLYPNGFDRRDYRKLSGLETISLDLFFLKTKRRRVIQTTQLALDFCKSLGIKFKKSFF